MSVNKKFQDIALIGELTWGNSSGDFMFSQSDIKEMEGVKVDQKNMYAYTMFGKELFVNLHLSKTGYTTRDSIAMRQVLDGLRRSNDTRIQFREFPGSMRCDK